MNRHCREDKCEVVGTVPATVAVFEGDLVLMNDKVSNIGGNASELSGANAAVDGKIYPITAGASAKPAQATFMDSFLGVALNTSLYGSTDTISCATAGVYRLRVEENYTTSTVTLGAVCSAVSSTVFGGGNVTTSATGNYTVIFGGLMNGSGQSIGYCVEDYASGSSYIKVRIRSKFAPAGRPAAGSW